MSFSSWLRNWKHSLDCRSMRKQSRRRKPTVCRVTPRPQLECLEARTLLDASGTLAPVTNDLMQVMTDGAHFQGAALQQDVAKLGHDIKTFLDQRKDAASDLALDVQTAIWGSVLSQIGAGLVEAGAASFETGLGIDLAVAGSSLAAYGVYLQVQGVHYFYIDLQRVITGTPKPAPAQPPAPTPSSVGTFSATLTPSSTDGNVPSNASQKVTLTLNAYGSGSLSISPFAGTPLTVNFPATTAQLAKDGSVSINYSAASGVQIGVDAGLLTNGNALQGNFFVYSGDSNFDAAYFYPGTLNRQS